MSLENKDCLIIWDSDDQCLSGCEDTLLWKKYEAIEVDRVYSVLQLVEENAEQLKSQYLALLYDLGECSLNGKKVIERLEIRPGFSYWWMTLLSEKSNLAKSPQIDNAIKLMAFNKWLADKDYRHIKLVSDNIQLIEAISHLTRKLKIDFEWKEVKSNKSRKSLSRLIYDLLPYYLQGLVWLIKHLITHWRLKGVGVKKWRKAKGKAAFVSYLFNLDYESARAGQFKSDYWTSLPQLLEECKVESNWLHIYTKNALIKNTEDAKKLINQFNKSHNQNQVHVTLHSFLSLKVIFSTVCDCFKMVKLSKSIEIQLKNNSGPYWPFLKEDYLSSMVGSTLMCNMLYLNLFQSSMESLPHQDIGIYLKENQGWEFGFIYSWRAAKHSSNLIGVPHTPAKFWDLRLYFDQRSCHRPYTICNPPLPDYVGMNGDFSKRIHLDGGYKESYLIELEALRYLYLSESVVESSDLSICDEDKITLLILTDYMKVKTIKQMEMLQSAVRYISNKKIRYLVKPHPAYQFLPKDYNELNLVVTNDPIPMLIDNCTIVYTSNSTSSAVDAYYAGKPVVTFLNPGSLNLSPLRGAKDVIFVSSPRELADVLDKVSKISNYKGQGEGYFYLDSKLPRWRSLFVKGDKIKKNDLNKAYS